MARVSKREIKKLACRTCGYIPSELLEECPVCGNTLFTDLWSGRFIVINPDASNLWKFFKEFRNIDKDHEGVFAIELE